VRHFGTVKSFNTTTGRGSICPSRAGGLIGFQKGAALWQRSVDPVPGQRLSYELALKNRGARAVKLRMLASAIEAHAHV
jgi:cold shock CspA family protein